MDTLKDSSLGGEPKVALATKASALDPKLNIPKQDIRLKFIDSEAECSCNFWMGLAKKGPLGLNQLLESQDVLTIFEQAATIGITEHEPILLSDTTKNKARFVYFTPCPEDGEVLQYSKDLAATVHSFAPPSLGIYLSPQLVSYDSNYALLKTILRDMVMRSSCKEFFLLLGEHGINPMLNSVLDLRAQLIFEKINLAVFH